MNTYTKFLTSTFLKSFFFTIGIFFSLVIILNILTEIEFFKNNNVKFYFPIYLALLNSADMIFEMLPFILIISTQLFFINIFNNNQIEIFKYSGLKNSEIVKIISINSFLIGIFVIFLFYSLSSNLKNVYLGIKNKFSTDQKYLAVVTNNGLWIKDSVNEKKFIVHASRIEDNFLVNTFISQFDINNKVVRHINSEKIDISDNKWLVFEPIIYKDNIIEKKDILKIKLNFDYKKIQSLFSNLSSLSLVELFELRSNYKQLNYSTIEVNLHINKILTFPIYLLLMVILGSMIMLKIKKYKSNVFKISIGLFISVIIYYLNNFFNIMGKSEKLPALFSIWTPLIILFLLNVLLSYKINEK